MTEEGHSRFLSVIAGNPPVADDVAIRVLENGLLSTSGGLEMTRRECILYTRG